MMKRVGGWLQGKPGQQAASGPLTALDEQNALQNALASASLIMNDEIEKAELELSKGITPFHKLGRATALFLRAALGFEKEIMAAAGMRIAEAEEAAAECQRRAVKDPSAAHQSEIYPPGTEFALCHAETLLMSAVVAVLNESLAESLRGFYKLRKAFGILSEISTAEDRYLKSQGIDSNRYTDSSSTRASDYTGSSEFSEGSSYTDGFEGSSHYDDDDEEEEEEDNDLEFVDAHDVLSALVTPLGYDGHLEFPGFNSLSIDDRPLPGQESASDLSGFSDSAADLKDIHSELDFRTITSDPIDLFIHSGTALCFGLLQLLLSMIPPAFARVLSIFSFRGNRENGFRLLWSATKFKHNINGAMAGLIYLGFHNGAIAFCDILSADALPETRLRSLLAEMRVIYPKSKLWLLEECRMLSRDRKMDEAISLLKDAPTSPLKQVEALTVFETSLHLMYLHRYQETSDSFIKFVSLSNWSHALYYYIAGSAQLELYRMHKTSNPEKAKTAAAKAEKYLLEVPLHTQKKRFMGRQLPFDVFTNRKIAKWEARAKSKHCNFVDAIGVSPLVEMMYFWNGISRMLPEQIEQCLARLAWSDDVLTNPHWQEEAVDEKCTLSFLRAVCLRNLGQLDTAKSTLITDVISHTTSQIKACDHPETWPLPVAHYEMAVCYWKEAGGENGDTALLQKCSEELAKVESWETFELEARVGLKVTTARDTLRKCGIVRA